MSEHLKTEINDQIAIITLNHATESMNILSKVVLEDLDKALDGLQKNKDLKGLIFISGKKDSFIAGANIEDIASFKTAEEATAGSTAMQEIFNKISNLPIPSVSAIHGVCLGGGLELSLACSWRIATNDAKTKLGLPEIQLGLIPGAGGTQRLPRLIGIEAALGMILTGKQVTGKKALKMGLIDACVPKQKLLEIAMKYARKKRSSKENVTSKLASNISKELPKWALEGNPLGRKVMYKKAKEEVEKKTKGFYPASYKALDAVFDGFDMRLNKALKLEAKFFGELAMTRESQSLIHLFHATTAIKKHPYQDAIKEYFGDTKCSNIGVVGAGLMGAGIATVCANKGIHVRLSDPSKEALGRALAYANNVFKKQLKRRRIKPFEKDQKMAHISPDTKPSGFRHSDVVIEAVFEDLELKQKILKDLESQGVHDRWVFASNTSAIPIKEIARVSSNPERVCGMHFFSPVEKMPLLEVVITDETADWVAGRAVQLGQDMGKQVIVVKDGPGFYTTRALAFFLAEASEILAEGTSIEVIDQAMVDTGFPVGPITLIDEVGIDVGMHVLETIEKAFPDRLKTPDSLQSIIDSGRLGRKNQKGFYRYEKNKKAGVDNDIYSLVRNDPDNLTKIETDEIVDRCLLIFVNESIRCLEEGILLSPYDGDVGSVFGLGFPPFFGGPFKYVDSVGAKPILEMLKGLEDKYGARFKPAAMLEEYASSNKKFFPNESN